LQSTLELKVKQSNAKKDIKNGFFTMLLPPKILQTIVASLQHKIYKMENARRA
jgi:hypothetical protein